MWKKFKNSVFPIGIKKRIEPGIQKAIRTWEKWDFYGFSTSPSKKATEFNNFAPRPHAIRFDETIECKPTKNKSAGSKYKKGSIFFRSFFFLRTCIWFGTSIRFLLSQYIILWAPCFNDVLYQIHVYKCILTLTIIIVNIKL